MHADALRRSTETGGRKSPATKTVRTARKVLSLVRSVCWGAFWGECRFTLFLEPKLGATTRMKENDNAAASQLAPSHPCGPTRPGPMLKMFENGYLLISEQVPRSKENNGLGGAIRCFLRAQS